MSEQNAACQVFSEYVKATGLFTSQVVRGMRPAETDTTAWLAGEYDHLRQRVEAGGVIEYVPPSPGPDYEFDAATHRYRLRQEIVERNRRRAAARQRIDELERKQARPLRELQIDPDSVVARERLRVIDAEIAVLRAEVVQR